MLKLMFWKKDSGNFMSHGKGLTEEQLKFFHQLKVGDRFIIYKNDRKTDADSALTLKVYVKTEAKPIKDEDDSI